MADWQLSFRHPGSGSLEIATCEQLVTDSVGNVTTEVGELSGNPRDFYSRSITIRGQRGDLKIELRADQGMRGANEPEPIISRVYLLVSAPYATKLAAWQALTTAFAKIGWIDDTLTSAAPIIDDATAAGDTSTVARIRAESAAALIEQARGCRYVSVQRRSSCGSCHHPADLRIGISAARVAEGRSSNGEAASSGLFSRRST